MRVNEIQQQLHRGEYEVDEQAVAEAILRRLISGPGRMSAGRCSEHDG